VPQPKRVAFGRINRRLPEEHLSLDMRPFREDVVALAESGELRAVVEGREWIAADMSLDPSGDFMTGVLGYSDVETKRDFEEEAFSWVKGPTREEAGASTQTLVPFAIDVRDDHRWVGFVPSRLIRVRKFSEGFSIVLNRAVQTLGLIAAEWEVNMLTDRSTIDEWLEENQDVVLFVRTVKFENPGRDISAERAEMRALAAKQKTESFQAPPQGYLRLQQNEEFEGLLHGVETGDVDIELKARSGQRFKSLEHADERFISDYGSDLETGMGRVLDALREYAEAKGR
jgi:hypothetical protein